MIDCNIVLLDLENSDIAAVSFEGTKTKQKLEGSYRDIKVYNFPDSRFPDTKSFHTQQTWRQWPTLGNQTVKCLLRLVPPPSRCQSIEFARNLQVSFPDCHKIQNFAK